MAVKHYKQAWTLSNFNIPSIGYRLSKCYYSHKDYINCVHVGTKILKKYPNQYGAIKGKFLDDAM